MIVIKLIGGLGNQMFQYALGFALKKKFKQNLFFEDSYYVLNSKPKEQFTVRKLEMDIFPNLHFQLAPKLLRDVIHVRGRILLKLRKESGRYFEINQVENEFVKIPDLVPLSLNVFSGYFQCEEYFRFIKRELKVHFTFPELDNKNKVFEKKIIESNAVSVHIRRGDYVSIDHALRYHGILPLSYYYDAIDLLKKTYKDLTFFIFSDDLDWVKKNLKFSDEIHYFISGNVDTDSWKDMALMAKAKHHIVANSSFSWWGAWLADFSGTTIAPSNWFNPEFANFRIEDFVPDSWIVIQM
jgi:hypothetical protein